MSTTPELVIRKVKSQHPFPWRYMTANGRIEGRVFVLDAAGVEVPMFDMLEVTVAFSVLNQGSATGAPVA
jgi:hypothetical protein